MSNVEKWKSDISIITGEDFHTLSPVMGMPSNQTSSKEDGTSDEESACQCKRRKRRGFDP